MKTEQNKPGLILSLLPMMTTRQMMVDRMVLVSTLVMTALLDNNQMLFHVILVRYLFIMDDTTSVTRLANKPTVLA